MSEYKKTPENCGGKLVLQTDGSWFCPDCGHRVKFEPRKQRKTTVEGVIAFHVSIKVTPEQLAAMSPEIITAFFDGIAKAQAAVTPTGEPHER